MFLDGSEIRKLSIVKKIDSTYETNKIANHMSCTKIDY